jgi:hypothetical protein
MRVMVTTALRASRLGTSRLAKPLVQANGPRRWVWPASLVAGGLVLFAAYLRQARTVPVMSDGASNALQAWDMLHGNLLLHGWTLTDLSFYTIDLPEYMALEVVHGLNPGTARVGAALAYTLVVLGAVLLAKGRATGKEGVVRAALAAAIMIAPPLGIATNTLISDPDHTATQLPLLLVWAILDRARPRWQVPVVVTALLAVSLVADPVVAYEGVLPIVVVCAVQLYRARRGQAPWPPLRESWYALSLAGGSLLSVGIADLTLRLIQRSGGFVLAPLDTTFAGVSSLSSHLAVTAQSVLAVFGADFSGDQLSAHAAIAVLHLAGVGLAGWATVRALRHFAGAELVVRILAIAVVVLLAAYTTSGSYNALGGPHEIVGILPAAAVLAGRLLAGPLTRGRHLGLVAVLVVAMAALLVHDSVQGPGRDADLHLAGWLATHHLDYGLATYWNASSVAVDSGGAVQVRPVNRNARGRIAPVNRDSVRSWYSAGQHDASFLVVPTTHSSCSAGSRGQWLATADADFGPPAASYRVGRFIVLVWPHNLLTQLARPMPVGSC